MAQDRTDWSAREYADALNNAVTMADILELTREVDEKWGAKGSFGSRVVDLESAAV
jgi:hypothetical protein